MAELTVAGFNQKFWAEDCLQRVSSSKVKGGESFQTHYLRLVSAGRGDHGPYKREWRS